MHRIIRHRLQGGTVLGQVLGLDDLRVPGLGVLFAHLLQLPDDLLTDAPGF